MFRRANRNLDGAGRFRLGERLAKRRRRGGFWVGEYCLKAVRWRRQFQYLPDAGGFAAARQQCGVKKLNPPSMNLREHRAD
jgi:hypothetical protein